MANTKNTPHLAKGNEIAVRAVAMTTQLMSELQLLALDDEQTAAVDRAASATIDAVRYARR